MTELEAKLFRRPIGTVALCTFMTQATEKIR